MSMEVKSQLRMTGEKSYESEINGKILKLNGGDPESPNHSPMQLLMSAISGCPGVDVVSIIRKKRKDITDFKVDVVAHRRDEHPKYYTDFELHFILTSKDATEKDLEQAVKLSMDKYCSVSAMFKSVAEINYKYTIVRSE
jgi:putative redox protein